MERELNEFLAALEKDKSGSDTKLAALKKRVTAKRVDLESNINEQEQIRNK